MATSPAFVEWVESGRELTLIGGEKQELVELLDAANDSFSRRPPKRSTVRRATTGPHERDQARLTVQRRRSYRSDTNDCDGEERG